MISVLARLLVFKVVIDRWRARSKSHPASGRPSPRARSQATGSGIPPQKDVGPGPDTPLELEPHAWKQTAIAAFKEIKKDRVPFVAAAMAYYFFLAIFPALIALIGILGLVDIDATGLVESLSASLPGGAGSAVTRAIESARSPSEAASLTAAIVGIAGVLWSGSSGMAALQTGLNVAYDVDHERKFMAKRAIGLGFLLATLLLGGVPSPFFTLGESPIYEVIGWILTLAAVIMLFSIFYYLGPNRESPAWQWVSPGGIFGALLWIGASVAFGWYVTTFNSYEKTYGPLAGVIVLILWLYLSSFAVLVGGELNAELERQAQAQK